MSSLTYGFRIILFNFQTWRDSPDILLLLMLNLILLRLETGCMTLCLSGPFSSPRVGRTYWLTCWHMLGCHVGLRGEDVPAMHQGQASGWGPSGLHFCSCYFRYWEKCMDVSLEVSSCSWGFVSSLILSSFASQSQKLPAQPHWGPAVRVKASRERKKKERRKQEKGREERRGGWRKEVRRKEEKKKEGRRRKAKRGRRERKRRKSPVCVPHSHLISFLS